jgi:hypothetical protein
MRAAIVIATALVLTGCSDAVGGTGQPGTDAPTSSASSAPTSSAPTSAASSTSAAPASSSPPSTSSSAAASGFPTDIKSLGALLNGNRTIKSAHVALTESAAGTTVTSAGEEELSNVTVQAMDMTETVNGATLRFIILGAVVYAKLPPATYQSTKPWVEMTASTTDPQLTQLYTSFESARTSGIGFTSDIFTAAAKNLRLIGTEQLDGNTVGHYSVSLDVASLPSDFPNRSALTQSGLSEIPLEMWVDAKGRTVRLTEHLTVGGQSAEVDYHLTKIDEPVSIQPPPAAQVQHG